jgi:hypothetical protein
LSRISLTRPIGRRVLRVPVRLRLWLWLRLTILVVTSKLRIGSTILAGILRLTVTRLSIRLAKWLLAWNLTEGLLTWSLTVWLLTGSLTVWIEGRLWLRVEGLLNGLLNYRLLDGRLLNEGLLHRCRLLWRLCDCRLLFECERRCGSLRFSRFASENINIDDITPTDTCLRVTHSFHLLYCHYFLPLPRF